jgi:hypothetical protein
MNTYCTHVLNYQNVLNQSKAVACAVWLISHVADVPLAAGQTVVSSTRIIIWVFAYVNISRGADVLLAAAQTVMASNIFRPNCGT